MDNYIKIEKIGEGEFSYMERLVSKLLYGVLSVGINIYLSLLSSDFRCILCDITISYPLFPMIY